jgi:hypothetical protein
VSRTVTSPPLPYPGEDAHQEAERLKRLPPGGSQTWLLLEFCDKPCLQVAPGMHQHRDSDSHSALMSLCIAMHLPSAPGLHAALVWALARRSCLVRRTPSTEGSSGRRTRTALPGRPVRLAWKLSAAQRTKSLVAWRTCTPERLCMEVGHAPETLRQMKQG